MAIGNVGLGAPRPESLRSGEPVGGPPRSGSPGGTREAPPTDGGAPGPEGSSGRPILPPPMIDVGNTATLLLELYTVIGDEQSKTSKESILTNRDKQKTLHEEVMKKLEEAARAAEKAANASTASKIFGWIAMAFAAVVAIAAVVVSGGALGPLVGLAVTATFMVLQGTGAMQKITDGIANGIAKMLEGFGMDPKAAQLAGQITAMVLVAAVMIAVTMGSSAGSSVAQMGGKIGELAQKVATFVADLVAKLPNSVQTLASISVVVGKAVAGASQIAQGGAQIGSAVHGRDAENAKAGKLDIDKLLVALRARLQQDIERIGEIQQNQSNVLRHMIDMVKGAASTMNEIAGRTGGQTA
jgi:hypothetical protein